MVSTGKKKSQQKKKLSQLNRTLNDFVLVNGTNVGAMANEALEPQTNGHHIDLRELLTVQVKTKS